MKNSNRLILLAVILIAASLSCNLPLESQTLPVKETPVYLDPPESLEEVIDKSGQIDPSTGRITVSFSQYELSGYLNTYLASQSELNIKDATVTLEDNLINISGKLQEGILSADIKFSLEPTIDPSGTIKLNMVNADLGPIPAPENLLNTISSLIEQSMAESMASGLSGIEIEQITISDGRIYVTGMNR